MIRCAALVVAMVVLAHGTGGFHEPEATGTKVDADTIEVDVSVRLDVSEGPVVVHLLLPGEEGQVKPLLEQPGGRWGSQVELRRADWRVVFEDLGSGNRSEEFSLTDLGVDRALLGGRADREAAGQEAANVVLPALLLAAAAAIVTLAGVWVAGRNRLRMED